MSMNIFEFAARNKLRFTSVRGLVTAEQLWEAPLRSKDGFNLNEIAKEANKAVKALTEDNFVGASPVNNTTHHVALDIVKHVIAVKIDEENTAEKRAARKIEKAKLLEILAEKQTGALSALSEQELQARITALSAD